MKLEHAQVVKLASFVEDWLNHLAVKPISSTETEPKFTASNLLPWLQNNVASLRKPELYVRGDGGPMIKPVMWEGVPFLPDLSIVSSEEKYISFEVKILREQDPGGSLSKAVGQTILYSKLGYMYSYGLVFDCRSIEKVKENMVKVYRLPVGETSSVYIYR